MLLATTSDPEGRWRPARGWLRLAGLAAVWIGLVQIPPGVVTHGRELAIVLCAGLALTLGGLALMAKEREES